MDDSFTVRVDRAFGSLEASSAAAASSSSSIPVTSSSLWCLTDEEIQRKEWIRDKLQDQSLPPKPPKPYSSFLQGLLQKPDAPQNLESDIQELDDDDSEEEEDPKQPQEWDIRSSIGMDCTLDNEEEEDDCDKVAVGREEAADDRFYMRSVNDYEVEIDSNNELPSSFRDVVRDPRANHRAAKLRLKEDDELVGDSDISRDAVNPSRENQTTTESKKHVSFQPGSEGKGDNEGVIGQSENLVMGESPGLQVAPLSQNLSSVPDYTRNPSKYTHYTFDSLGDVDEESNRKACMDLFNSLKGSKAMERQDDVPIGSLTSIVFTPKKKPSDTVNNGNTLKKNRVIGYEEYMHKKAVPLGISAEDSQDSEVCAMDEDEAEIAPNKSSRRYRTKGNPDVD